MVLCHGGPGLWDFLEPVAAMLDDIAIVHRWDQRGAGRSDRTPPYSIQRFVDDLEALRTHFGHKRWIVAGHSWGARLALEYALCHPERTEALVYFSGTGIGREWRNAARAAERQRLEAAFAWARLQELDSRERTDDEERELCALKWMTDYVDSARGRAQSEAILLSGMLPNYEVNAAISADYSGVAESTMIARCESLVVPTLIVHGDRDPRPVSATDSLVSALPKATRVVIEDGGHLPWVEQPGRFASVVREFVAARP